MVKIKVPKKRDSLGRVKAPLIGASLDGRPKAIKTKDGINKNHADYATFNPERIEHICEMIRHGASRADAAKYYGGNTERLRKALRRHPEWERLVEQAEVDCKIHHLQRIHGGEREWKASAWMLSRKWYQEYAQRTPDSFNREQVMGLFLMFSRLISEEITDPQMRSRIMGRLSDLTHFLEKMKTQKAKSDTTYDGDG